MKRFWTSVFALLLVCAASAPVAARTFKQEMTVTNNTAKCAWITIYGSYEGEPNYHIAASANERPRSLKPGQTYTFTGALLNNGIDDIRVRAQVDATAECSGGQIGDTDKYFHSVSYTAGRHKTALWKGTGNGWFFQ